MALELIAVEGCTIIHSVGSPISGGTFTITTPASLNTKVDGKGVYSASIAFTFAGGDGAGATSGTVAGGGTIAATAVYVKDDGAVVSREGDTGTLTAVGTNSAPPPPTLPFVGNVEISVAGQTTVKAE